MVYCGLDLVNCFPLLKVNYSLFGLNLRLETGPVPPEETVETNVFVVLV